MRASAQHAIFITQLSGGEIAGCVAVFIYRSRETDLRAEISGLVVYEPNRAQRIGHRCLERAQHWACEKRCETIGLCSNVVRSCAHGRRQAKRNCQSERRAWI
jgi:N-acetylglutamate synthase-like GNAT family acetyltransferase